MARALLISDLHLSAERPEANEAFIGFLEREAAGAGALYILGDLFEFWIGDDDAGTPFHAVLAGLLRGVADRGTSLYLMHGNRDFLLGRRFCDLTGARLLPDPSVAELGGVRTLLLHGDTLCTDDEDYQSWRRTARSAQWQARFLAKPLAERRAEMLSLRAKSAAAIRAKPARIMDANPGAVQQAFRDHGVARMIHGHTHRCARHALAVDGRKCERWVLPDWYGAGGYLAIGPGAPKLVRY